jgi:hypothetical protein
VLQEPSGRVRIEVSAQHALELGENSAGMVDQWVSLRHDEVANLAGRNDGGLESRVLQEPVTFYYDGQWNYANTLATATVTLGDVTPAAMSWRAEWTWVTPDTSAFHLVAENGLSADGTWSVSMRLFNDNATPRVIPSLEYAYTNVRPEIAWVKSQGPAWGWFSFAEESGGTALRVTHDPSVTAPAIATDANGTNYYWSVGSIELAPGAAWSAAWTNSLVPLD